MLLQSLFCRYTSLLLLHVFPFRGNVQFKIIPLEWVFTLMGSWDLCCKRFFPPCWVFGEPDPGMRNFLSHLYLIACWEQSQYNLFGQAAAPLLPVKDSESSGEDRARAAAVSLPVSYWICKNLGSLTNHWQSAVAISHLLARSDTFNDSKWK